MTKKNNFSILIKNNINNSILKTKGSISNYQDFVVHDGPGLRLLIFLKGCPLRCGWCQNPQNLSLQPEIEYHPMLCLECFKCSEICPIPGTIINDKEKRINREICNKCMKCVDVCLGKALTRTGEIKTVEDVLEYVLPYKTFFDQSGGGVTLSGGDPIFQPDFTLGLLSSFKELGINTTMETCGYIKYEILKRLVEETDLIIFDIKHMNEQRHIEGTGKSNKLILENLKKICNETNTEIEIHIPLISGYNDNEENIRKTAEFISSLNKITKVDLLPFNELASGSYKAIGLEWKYSKNKKQTEEQLNKLKKIVESFALDVNIGGLR